MGGWRIRADAWDLEWPCADGESVLESAERAGLALLSSCRNGSCRSCRCQLVSGQVRYRLEWPGLSREEKEEGWILPCVAEPTQDCVLIGLSATPPPR